ncbi:MAG TPA: FAD-dependent oxidoreductase [Acidobacteriaceae bacterium]|nr:FAD-dependent oxidoreductase [Acidobacteriaceae bacterium]
MSTRAEKFARLEESNKDKLDIVIVGGGATGLGLAVDAATRGFRTALVEAGDFAQATSSRATKLVHGGVRYLVSGQLHLVYEALRERKIMLENAPHLVHALPFVTPAYKWFDLPYYSIGLKAYEVLSGKSSLGPTRVLSAGETLERVPGIATKGLRGSLLYYDGQFDDARLALALARTAEDHGATVLNYARCTGLHKQGAKLSSVTVEDIETGHSVEVHASVFINATGIFVDDLRRQDQPSSPHMLSVSRGTHIVVPGEVLGNGNAIMVPKTRDGRIIFAIPWLGKVVIGTTDLPASSVAIEPGHEAREIDFLLETINPYLARPLERADILSVFSGLRPLVTGGQAKTSKLSREHTIEVAASGLITVAGGKWTTYRRMAEDTLSTAIGHGVLPDRPCVTRSVRLHGAPEQSPSTSPLSRYGTEAAEISDMWVSDPQMATLLDPELPFTHAEVIFAARYEMARTVEDVLSRRTRALLLDARAAQRSAPAVARLLAAELGRGPEWVERETRRFIELAQQFYFVSGRAADANSGVPAGIPIG